MRTPAASPAPSGGDDAYRLGTEADKRDARAVHHANDAASSYPLLGYTPLSFEHLGQESSSMAVRKTSVMDVMRRLLQVCPFTLLWTRRHRAIYLNPFG